MVLRLLTGVGGGLRLRGYQDAKGGSVVARARRGRSRRRGRAGACLIGGFLCLSVASSQALEPGEAWVSRFGGSVDSSDRAQALAVSPDGTKVFVTGWVVTGPIFEEELDYGTVAYDVITGEELWARSYDGPSSEFFEGDKANAIAVAPDGSRVFVTGDSTGLEPSGDSVFATVAYDADTGDQIWASRYNAPGGGGTRLRTSPSAPTGTSSSSPDRSIKAQGSLTGEPWRTGQGPVRGCG